MQYYSSFCSIVCVKNYFPFDVTMLFTYSTFGTDARDFMKIYIS